MDGITNPPIDELLDKSGSKYSLVLYAAKRARQINAYYSQLGEGLLELGSSELELSLGSIGFSVFGNVSDELVVLSGHKLRGEELGSSWGLVVKGNDGKGSGGSESSDGSLGSHVD